MCNWDKKKLNLSHFSRNRCGPEKGAMRCSVMEYVQSVAMKKPGGNDSSQAGRQVFFIATQSLVFPRCSKTKETKTTISIAHSLNIYPISAVVSRKIGTNITAFSIGRSSGLHEVPIQCSDTTIHHPQ
jgi:hypothetical protein